jgi:hypothetical protein
VACAVGSQACGSARHLFRPLFYLSIATIPGLDKPNPRSGPLGLWRPGATAPSALAQGRPWEEVVLSQPEPGAGGRTSLMCGPHGGFIFFNSFNLEIDSWHRKNG